MHNPMTGLADKTSILPLKDLTPLCMSIGMQTCQPEEIRYIGHAEGAHVHFRMPFD